MKRGEDRKSQMMCPYCKNIEIEYLSIRWSSYRNTPSFGACYTYCDQCKHNAGIGGGNIKLYKPKFSIFNEFDNKDDEKRFGTLLKKIYEIPGNITRNKAFEFFRSERQAPDDIYY
jgi:hypothetical protein